MSSSNYILYYISIYFLISSILQSYRTVVGWHHVGRVFARALLTEREPVRPATLDATIGEHHEVCVWRRPRGVVIARSCTYTERPGRRAVFVHLRIGRAVGRRPGIFGIHRPAATIFSPPFSRVEKKIK